MDIGFRCSEGGHRFEAALREVERAEAIGFDSVFLSEHVGLPHHWPSPHVALAAFATRTETIELGTSVVLPPQTHPVRLASEAALVDVISSGRLKLGVGLGWHRAEMENLGWDFDARGPRMTEHLRAMNALFHRDAASFEGDAYAFEDVELNPRPVQEPHPPIWVGGRSPQSLKRAARLGDAWFPAWDLSMDDLADRYDRYEEFIREANRIDEESHAPAPPADRRRPLVRFLVIDRRSDRAFERARALFEQRLEAFRERGADKQPPGLRAALDDGFEAYARERLIVGDPAECVDLLGAYEERLDVDHVVLKLYNPGTGHEQLLEQLELVGDRVLPAFD